MNSYLVHLIAIGANFLLSKLSPSNTDRNILVNFLQVVIYLVLVANV